MTVRIVPVSDVRQNITTLLRELETAGEPCFITLYSRPKAVLMSFNDYNAMLARFEDLEDVLSMRQVKAEPARPYEEFLAEYRAEQSVRTED